MGEALLGASHGRPCYTPTIRGTSLSKNKKKGLFCEMAACLGCGHDVRVLVTERRCVDAPNPIKVPSNTIARLTHAITRARLTPQHARLRFGTCV
jgi:hypothetical protein